MVPQKKEKKKKKKKKIKKKGNMTIDQRTTVQMDN